MQAAAVEFGRQAITYPESDGEPLGETEVHVDAIIYLRELLKDLYRAATDVYVGCDMLLYYEEGNPAARVSPDVFVVRGVSPHKRRTYKLWEETVPPTVVFEVTSRGTRLEDVGTKRGLYELLGVKEYFLVDPMAEYLKPPLQGYRLDVDEFHKIEAEKDGSLVSAELGLELHRTAHGLRVRNRENGEELLSPQEAMQGLRDAEARATQADTIAEREAQRAEREAQRAEREVLARQSAEARLQQLEAELAQLRSRG